MYRCRLLRACAAALLWLCVLPQTAAKVALASPPAPTSLPGHLPPVVSRGQARLVGHHRSTDTMSLSINLRLRNKPALDQFLADVGNPHNPRYHHFLGQDQANQAFDPTPDDEQKVTAWLRSNGLSVTRTYPNHLLVDARGTFGQVEQMLQISLNDYLASDNGRQVHYYSTDRDPTVDGSVSPIIQSIAGLDNYPAAHPSTVTNGNDHRVPYYYPEDFAWAYDVRSLWNNSATCCTGAGQQIAITLFGAPASDVALVGTTCSTVAGATNFAGQTGARVAATCNGKLQVYQDQCIQLGTCSPDTTPATLQEAGLDIEYTSGLAPDARIDFYEGSNDFGSLERILNWAGTDANDNAQISDSWTYYCETGIDPSAVSAMNDIFAANSATGHNYFFASGDKGSEINGSLCADYPASSPYVTSVGGTEFNSNINEGEPSESVWDDIAGATGGGYSQLAANPQPAWQVGITQSTTERGYPDVAADAGINSAALACWDTPPQAPRAAGSETPAGLAAPAWPLHCGRG